MRRILALVPVAALAIGAADAASATEQGPVLMRTPGAQFLELRGGHGRAVVTRRGSLLVSVGRGRIRIVDLPGGRRPNLSPSCRRRAHRVSRTTLEVRGRNIGCFISSGRRGGPWQAILTGRRISASGVVKGSLTLDAQDEGRTGRFKIGGEGFRAWPREAVTYSLFRK